MSIVFTTANAGMMSWSIEHAGAVDATAGCAYGHVSNVAPGVATVNADEMFGPDDWTY